LWIAATRIAASDYHSRPFAETRKGAAMPVRAALVALVLAVIPFAVAMAPSPRAPESPSAAEGEFTLDTHYSMMVFRVRHMGACWFWGRVARPTGTFLLDAESLSDSFIDITMEMKYMDTGNDNRNRFALGPDFFDVRKNPTSTFKSTSVSVGEGGVFEVTGDLTMAGVTKPITVTLDDYTERQTQKLGYRSGFECTFEISRTEFGMTKFFEDEALGDTIRIIAAVEGVRK
jgi:polyisoprenoid-binding protein YceI